MKPREHELRTAVRVLDRVGGNLKRHGYYYRNHYDFLLREGEFYELPLYPPAVRLAPRLCFFNALVLAIVRGYPYVEGMAIGPYDGGTVHHAWNLDADGKVIDATWPRPGRAYLGVPFSAVRANNATWEGDESVLQDRRPSMLLCVAWTPEASPGDVSGLLEKIARDAFDDPVLGPQIRSQGIGGRDELEQFYRQMAVGRSAA